MRTLVAVPMQLSAPVLPWTCLRAPSPVPCMLIAPTVLPLPRIVMGSSLSLLEIAARGPPVLLGLSPLCIRAMPVCPQRVLLVSVALPFLHALRMLAPCSLPPVPLATRWIVPCLLVHLSLLAC